ncbi:MAG: DUF881 domain-containing protein [Bacillota bacterium]|nr:DUF881 domain-containing protein [Bacillota bacterium]
MKLGSSHAVVDNKLLVLVTVVLILNTVLVGLNFNTMNMYLMNNTEEVDLVPKQVIAQDMLEYSRRLAQDLGVQNRPSVREALATFNYEIDLAKDTDELARLIFNYGRQAQETILREWDALLREKILILINQDKNLKKETGKIQFTLRISQNDGVAADPLLLHEDTLAEILELYLEGGMSQERVFRIEVEESRSRMLVPYNPLDYIQTLTEEMDSLRVNMHELRVASGLAEMAGHGIVISLYDAQHGYTASDIIHDSDVRDVVNELFASGAKGVSVGGQRLISTSPIRCVGPVIRVNQKEIPANPVVIEAVGDPEVLSSGLDIIRFSLEFHRNFRIDIEKKDSIVLPQFRN